MFGRSWDYYSNKVTSARNAYMNYNGGDNNKNQRLLNQWSDAIDNANEHINGSDSRRTFINEEIRQYNHQVKTLNEPPAYRIMSAALNLMSGR